MISINAQLTKTPQTLNQPSSLSVTIEPPPQCNQCQMCQPLSHNKSLQLPLSSEIKPSSNQVKLSIATNKLLSMTLISYTIPLFTMFFGAFLGQWLDYPETGIIFMGFLGLAMAIVGVYFFNKKGSQTPSAIIVEDV